MNLRLLGSAGFSSVLRIDDGARTFLLSVFFFGAAAGALGSVLNNFFYEIAGITPSERGVLEAFRETPGLLLIFILALMHRFSEWKILRAGALMAMLGAAGLLFTSNNKILITLLIMAWSTGEHVLMPARNSIAMHLARPGREGAALGFSSSMMNFGHVAGSVIAAAVFFTGVRLLRIADSRMLYNLVWLIVAGLTLLSWFFARPPRTAAAAATVARPRLLFRRKFGKFYILELFYGARKQIFITFAPYVLIQFYGMSTSVMAVMMGCCAAVNIFCGPLIGRLIDRLGYRRIMIYDTLLLFWVCLLYGFAYRLFPPGVAYAVVCVNFILDAIISTASMASSLYVREISDSTAELTATLTTGISVNHLISVLAALGGGWLWMRFGVQMLFVFAAVMALLNSWVAATITAKKQPSYQ